MPSSRSPEVDAYVDGLPEPRAGMVAAIRDICAEELDGFDESIEYRMPSWSRDGEVELALANQKQYVSFYVMRTDVLDAHRDQVADLDVGKGCIRYRRPDQLDLDVVRSLARATAATRGKIC